MKLNLYNEDLDRISKLEKEIGLGNATIRTWRTSSPSVDRLKLVADYFNVTMDELISANMEKS